MDKTARLSLFGCCSQYYNTKKLVNSYHLRVTLYTYYYFFCHLFSEPKSTVYVSHYTDSVSLTVLYNYFETLLYVSHAVPDL